MGFTDASFLILFLPIVLILYSICQKNYLIQNIILLISSIIFYSTYNIKYIFILTVCVLVTYLGGLIGSSLREKEKQGYKAVLISAIILNLLILVFFKYYSPEMIERLYCVLPFGNLPELPEILLPVGVSFYIFQSTSYLMDIYYDKVKTEKNLITYATFVSFFPTIISGPILKSKEHLADFQKARKVEWKELQSSLFIFLYGAFLKLVIANRLGLLTSTVFGNYQDYHGWPLLISAVAYSLQIYTDFAGYSFMAIGIARMFGFKIKDNFSQPYFATSVVDFWKRWHISLTSWFRDYLYIPLGGNRKGVVRRYINVVIVFLVSGIWHGVTLPFIIWGALNAMLQIIEMLTKGLRDKTKKALHINDTRIDYRILRTIINFGVVTICWIFFNSPDFRSAIGYIAGMVNLDNAWILFDKSIFKLGLSQDEFIICGIALIIMFIVSLMREKGKRVDCIVKQGVVFKYLLFFIMFFAVLVYGIYGAEYSASAFIYAGF